MGSLAICGGAGARGEAPANPWLVIVERNVFRLQPPTPLEAAVPPKPPLPKITLNGITTIFGDRRALMTMAAVPTKPGGPPGGERSYMLAEGQRDGDLEVQQIDENAGTARVSYAGSIMTLTLEKNDTGAHGPSTVTGGGLPGPMLAANAPQAVGAGHPLNRPLPGGFRRSPPATGPVPVDGPSPTPAPMAGATAGSDANGTGAGLAPAVQAEAPLTPEEKAVLIEVQQELHKNDPTYPALPPAGL